MLKLTLDNDAIESAIAAYVSEQGINLAGKTLEIDIVARRGANAGVEATVAISDTPPANTTTDCDMQPTSTAEEIKNVIEDDSLFGPGE